MDLLQTLLVYMSLVFASSVQTAPEPSVIPEVTAYPAAIEQTVAVPTPAPTPVPTINITPNPAYRTLKMGDKGSDVRKLQETLKEYGYYTADIDGAYGNQTRKAVEHFQYMHGLSADGMAGRHTLTVLYESNQVRLPEGQEATPAPTSQTQLTVAYTPVPEPAETPAPTATPDPTVTPIPEETVVPAEEEPLVLEMMSGYTVLLNGEETEWIAFKGETDVYLPVLEVLKKAGVFVISSSSLEMDEYAFASGGGFNRFTHTENKQGQPADLQIYCSDELQTISNHTLYRENDVLYMPAEGIEILTGALVTVDDAGHTIQVDKAE